MTQLALELDVIGLINAQFAIQAGDIYVLEVNPRASRTIPFVSKTIGLPLAKIAARCMSGESLAEQGYSEPPTLNYYAVKQPVFPFAKFIGADPILGPEMKSTGEVMGIGPSFAAAFAKSQSGAGNQIKQFRKALLSVRDADKQGIIEVAQKLINLGFSIIATRGTAQALEQAGIDCQVVNKVNEGRPHLVDMIKNGEVDFVVNTTEGTLAIADSFTIRSAAVHYNVVYDTTLAGGLAICHALGQQESNEIKMLQQLHSSL